MTKLENNTEALIKHGVVLIESGVVNYEDWVRQMKQYAQFLTSSNNCEDSIIKTNGHYIININDKENVSTAFASMCHELGHFFCHHLMPPTKDWWTFRSLSWQEEEFEAEIVSYIICERCGVKNKSWEYLSCILGQNNQIPQNISIDRIFKAANEVERMLDPDLDPRTCFLYKYDKSFHREYDNIYPEKRNTNEEEI